MLTVNERRELYREAFALLERAQELLLDAREKHERAVQKRKEQANERP